MAEEEDGLDYNKECFVQLRVGKDKTDGQHEDLGSSKLEDAEIENEEDKFENYLAGFEGD